MSEILVNIIGALAPLVVAALIALLSYVARYFSNKAEMIKETHFKDMLQSAIWEAQRVAAEAIKAVNQTLVDALKEKAKDGKLTKEEALEAIDSAKNYFRNHISDWAMRYLKAELGPIEVWLAGLIESLIPGLKAEKTFQVASNPR